MFERAVQRETFGKVPKRTKKNLLGQFGEKIEYLAVKRVEVIKDEEKERKREV